MKVVCTFWTSSDNRGTY